jgi:hypothetical protein
MVVGEHVVVTRGALQRVNVEIAGDQDWVERRVGDLGVDKVSQLGELLRPDAPGLFRAQPLT